MKPIPTHVSGVARPPVWLRLGLPLTVYPLVLLSIAAYRPLFGLLQRKEGLIEYMTVLLVLVGVGYGVALLSSHRLRGVLSAGWLKGWFIVATLGMLVFAGEELSWGQHLGLWGHEDVPEAIKAVNDQDETNFHNMSNALDQGITNIILVGTLVAFVGIPLLLKHRNETMGPDNPGFWFWPRWVSIWWALGVLLIKVPGWVYKGVTDATSAEGVWRHSEIHEFYIAGLMTCYMADVYVRAREISSAKAAGVEPSEKESEKASEQASEKEGSTTSA
jgi:hypothetical protein